MPQPKKITSEELEVELAERSVPIVIDFYAAWCIPILSVTFSLRLNVLLGFFCPTPTLEYLIELLTSLLYLTHGSLCIARHIIVSSVHASLSHALGQAGNHCPGVQAAVEIVANDLSDFHT